MSLKPGRKQPQGDPRKLFSVRMSKDEIANLKARAEEAGMDASSFVRTAMTQTVILRDNEAQRVVYLLCKRCLDPTRC